MQNKLLKSQSFAPTEFEFAFPRRVSRRLFQSLTSTCINIKLLYFDVKNLCNNVTLILQLFVSDLSMPVGLAEALQKLRSKTCIENNCYEITGIVPSFNTTCKVHCSIETEQIVKTYTVELTFLTTLGGFN